MAILNIDQSAILNIDQSEQFKSAYTDTVYGVTLTSENYLRHARRSSHWGIYR